MFEEGVNDICECIKKKKIFFFNFQSTYAGMKIPHLSRMKFLRKIRKLSTTKNRTLPAYIHVNIMHTHVCTPLPL